MREDPYQGKMWNGFMRNMKITVQHNAAMVSYHIVVHYTTTENICAL